MFSLSPNTFSLGVDVIISECCFLVCDFLERFVQKKVVQAETEYVQTIKRFLFRSAAAFDFPEVSHLKIECDSYFVDQEVQNYLEITSVVIDQIPVHWKA